MFVSRAGGKNHGAGQKGWYHNIGDSTSLLHAFASIA